TRRSTRDKDKWSALPNALFVWRDSGRREPLGSAVALAFTRREQLYHGGCALLVLVPTGHPVTRSETPAPSTRRDGSAVRCIDGNGASSGVAGRSHLPCPC